mgnify:FL=1
MTDTNKAMNRKMRYILLTLSVVIVLALASYIVDSIQTKRASQDMMENLMMTIAADPSAATIKDKNEKDITDEFLDSHLESMMSGNYSQAIKEIRDNHYSAAVMETPRNVQFFQKP